MGYCIAFSIDGVTDVTRRYVRSRTKHGLDRTRASEEVLLWVIHEIRRIRREKFTKEELKRVTKEDEREEREMRAFMAQSITADINSLLPGRTSSSRSDEIKVPVTRQDGAVEWVDAAPGATGRTSPGDRR